jgi:hypothetical protein
MIYVNVYFAMISFKYYLMLDFEMINDLMNIFYLSVILLGKILVDFMESFLSFFYCLINNYKKILTISLSSLKLYIKDYKSITKLKIYNN